MNTKTIFGLSFAAFFAITMMVAPASAVGPLGYLYFGDDPIVDVKSNNNPNNANDRIKVSIDTNNLIPTDGSAIFGYAVFTGGAGLNNVLVLVTHLPLDDSDHEDPVSGFHTHVLDLKGSGNLCTGFDAEVDLENSVLNEGFDLDANWEVDGDDATIGYTPTKLLNDSTTVDGIASFTVKPMGSGASLQLCVDVVDTFPDV